MSAHRGRSPASNLVTFGLTVASCGCAFVLSAPSAGAINPCETATPPEGCPPLHAHPPRRPPPPVAPEIYQFAVTPGAWTGWVDVSFQRIRLDPYTTGFQGKPGSPARGYVGHVECSNGSATSAPAKVDLDPGAPVHRGPDGRLEGTKVMVVPQLQVDMPAANPASWCKAWVSTPPDTKSSIDRSRTRIDERLGDPLAVTIEAKVEQVT
ncbi:MAG: hypothetical protein JWN46_46 [Acidimicrobiales bacterium]|nr:hypothetical protein [Acidimicrobiales bacterium]